MLSGKRHFISNIFNEKFLAMKAKAPLLIAPGLGGFFSAGFMFFTGDDPCFGIYDQEDIAILPKA
ncbi:MAG: hypothetical protein K940chlam9_00709 [Chlamydiae bacterium]|nr:hypothetical protein [Chlamydiota bacterium]